MIRTTTRSLQTAEAIRDRLDFTTSGALRGLAVDNGGQSMYWSSGMLSGPDFEALSRDSRAKIITYVVWSYSTPIAWCRTDGTWHVVEQKFSPTTTKHQGNLYLVTR